MGDVTFTELRNKASKFIDKVQQGETIRVYRRGKLAAVIVPPGSNTKRPFAEAPLLIPGVEFSRAILQGRNESGR